MRKFLSNGRRRYLLFLFLSLLMITLGAQNCGSDKSGDETPPFSASKEITAFSFNAQDNAGLSSDVIGLISGTDITATVPYGTDMTALAATFTTTGVSVTVGGADQTSGTTANNFFNSVTYAVTAANGSTQEYTVTVTEASNTAKEITAFSFNAAYNEALGLSANVIATISDTEITATVPYGTEVFGLVATFFTTGVSVKIGGTIQTSYITPNDFTGSLTYTVTAADGSTQDYTVIVTVAPPSATKELTAFSFTAAANAAFLADVTGVINGTTITVTVPFETDATALVATFSTTGASVKVGSAVQTSGATTNSFTGSVIYTVTAEDSSTQDYTVTVWSAGKSVYYTAGSVSFNMVYVPGKSFRTGTDDSGIATVSSGYLIGETEVTYELWSTVHTWATVTDGSYTFANAGVQGNSGGGTNQHPVTTINWRDALVWMNALTEYYNAQNGTSLEAVYYSDAGYTTLIKNSSDGSFGSSMDYPNPGSFDDPYVKTDANGFRFLSSDEWELAARYKTDSNGDGDIIDAGEYYPGNYASGATAAYTDFDATSFVAWFGNSTTYGTGNTTTTQAVGQKTPNALGLYDMNGNVREWSFDWYTSGSNRVLRGGSYFDPAGNMRVGYVSGNSPYGENNYIGFRPARTP